jgi:outer membrane lipoprotein-sorting protein
MISAFLLEGRTVSLLEELNGIFILARGEGLNDTEVKDLLRLHTDDLEYYVVQCRRDEEVGLVQLGGQ